MTRITLLEHLKEFTESSVQDLLLPVQADEEAETIPPSRPAEIYVPRLPETASFRKKAPFITHEIVTGKDKLEPGPSGAKFQLSSAVVRTCFCVYHENEQEGGLALLNLMERLRIALLEQVVIGGQFKLDLDAGMETLVYPSDPDQNAPPPFYLGEMLTTWTFRSVERKLLYGRENNGRPYPGTCQKAPGQT